MARMSFSIHFTSKYELFSLGQNFLSVQKIFCPGRRTRQQFALEQNCCLRNGPSLSRQNNNCRHRAYLLPTSKNCCFLPFMEKGQPSLSPYNLPMPFYIDYYTYTFCTVQHYFGVSNKRAYLINILSRHLDEICDKFRMQ